ncbi:MAG TPA: FliH/SctL family protein [Candidatus Acidoferrum sp.]|nr:FliH/SctL family protein [Candidatus Acidoferrum sp.]
MSFESSVKGGATLQSEPFLYAPTSENGGATGLNEGMPWNGREAKSRAEQAERELYERGVRDGEARAKAGFDARAAALQAGVGQAVGNFRKESDEYFGRIETEVVQLALAIARKILHRESQIDPLLLTGLVHVALEKLDSGSHVRLKANPADVQFWNEYFAQRGGAGNPELIGDATVNPGECALEAEVGTTRISLETQLKEIEQGFFDLLEQRPRPR